MNRTIAILATAGLLAASGAYAQNSPPPGNVNPGSMQSGAEQTGAPNQPRSKPNADTRQQKGTTGMAPKGARQDMNSSPESTAGGAQGTSKKGTRER